jgi:flagellar motor switch protein FliN/FliY
MNTFLDCWISVASALFSQAVAGEPELAESLPKPIEDAGFAFTAEIAGDLAGRFSVLLDPELFDIPLLGEGVDQRAGWEELLREVAVSATGEYHAKTGKNCRVEEFKETPTTELKISIALELKSATGAWTIFVRDDLRAWDDNAAPKKAPADRTSPMKASDLSAGVELLLDIELEATLRFGCREMPLGEILDLGPGDVVELDRHVSDPVDLIVGDKIVARGEVVLVNGNFGLRIMEVAAPRKRLESIRCLF